MVMMAFDSLRYARRLREVGVPEPQADVQAELMAEAFGFYAENILTRDHFTDVINAQFARQDAKLVSLETKIDKRFAEQDAKLEQRFATLERSQLVLMWMFGVMTLTVVVPQLQVWFRPIG